MSSSPSALSSLCRRLRTAFGGGDADAAFVWRPGDADVCPSSLAKFFHDLGAEVLRVCLQWNLHLEKSEKTLLLNLRSTAKNTIIIPYHIVWCSL